MAKRSTPACTPVRNLAQPAKPWRDFPLHWHKSGRWRKKYRGKHYYFVADPIKSYDAWKELEDKLLSGDRPTASERSRKRYTLQDAINVFLHHQHGRFTRGEIGDAQMAKYVKEIKTELPKVVSPLTRLEDFCDEQQGPALFGRIRQAAVDRGLQAAEKHVTYVRAMFELVSKRGEHYLIAAPCFGDGFKKPTIGQIERAKAARLAHTGDQIWTIEEATRLIQNAIRRDVHLYAHLVLMAIAGYTSADVAALPLKAIDHKNAVINFPRVKNGRRRLCPLIKPLQSAIDASLKLRPLPAAPEFAHLAFLTRNGTPLNINKAKLDEKNHATGKILRKDVINLRLMRLCDTLDQIDREKLKPRQLNTFVGLNRAGQGQKIFRTLNYRAAIGAGVHDDFIAVLRGRRFNRPIEDYYLRNDLRGELVKLVTHIAKTFKIPSKVPVSLGGLRYNGPYAAKPSNPPADSPEPASGEA